MRLDFFHPINAINNHTKINLSMQSGAGQKKIKEAIPLPRQMGIEKNRSFCR